MDDRLAILWLWMHFIIFCSSQHDRVYKPVYTQEQLLSFYDVPHSISDDVDMDPCKAGSFMGDMAIPDLKHEEDEKEASRKYSRKLDDLKREVFQDGLQIEEEGLSDLVMKDLIASNSNKLSPVNVKHDRSTESYMTSKNDDRAKERKHSSQGRRRTRAATARKERVWDYGVIPYQIDNQFSGTHKALFKQAMRHWENFTCIKFVEREPHHSNYIVFTERPCGCCSFVGKRGNGAQAISIGKNCDKFGIVVHELGHVVGFWHEHTRPDRDTHVNIVKDHIMIGQEYNFNKLTHEEVNSLGLSYDYESIMHYARNTFSKGTFLDTIHPIENVRNLKRKPEIGQRIKLSEGDISQTKLLYKCPKCGRSLQESSGSFSYYQKAGEDASLTTKCEWRIQAAHGDRILLNISHLELHKSDQCSQDYLEIRDGYWHKSKLIGRFCGNGRIHDPVVAYSSHMLITSVISVQKNTTRLRGFSASYESSCGGEIELDKDGNSNRLLESPNYPDDYRANKECVWKIVAPVGFHVAIKFQSFEVENHDSCSYDYVEIADSSGTIIGTYCGYKLPPDVRSTENSLFVKFFSDGTVQKAGFSAILLKEFDECSLPNMNHGCQQLCVNTLGGYECACNIGYQLHSDGKHCEDTCGGRIEATNGTIVSPSFPDLYPGNKSCVWEIVAPPQHRVILNFTHFDLEGNNIHRAECDYDKVEVYSSFGGGGGNTMKKHGTYCGALLPPLITSETNVMRVHFDSDNSIHKSGFALLFDIDMDECSVNNGGCAHQCTNTIGGYQCSCNNGFSLHGNSHDCKEGGCKFDVTAPSGNITSPNYPAYYPSKKECVWKFIATPGHRIKLEFEKFELEAHQECSYDHLVVYDGDSADSGLTLGRFCGTKLPYPLVSSSNQMYMLFKSDSSVQFSGFLATHTTACGGRLEATNRVKHLYSHALYGEQGYENNADCMWSIEVSEEYANGGSSVHLTFLTFDVEDEKDCNYDSVEISSGGDDGGSTLAQHFNGKYCGNSLPQGGGELISTGETLLIRFKTDSTVSMKGFSASYVAVEAAQPTSQEEVPSLSAADQLLDD